MKDRRTITKICENPICKRPFITKNHKQKFHKTSCGIDYNKQIRRRLKTDKDKFEGISTDLLITTKIRLKTEILDHYHEIVDLKNELYLKQKQLHNIIETLKIRKHNEELEWIA